MCGIAGFSLSPNSNIKVRQLANSLLTAIEDRGYMASGYAYQVGNDLGYYKSATRGSMLKLKGLPLNARNVILHTRLATHGSITDNRNNHPVTSPSQDIALVHNGVIYNHNEVRLKIDGDLPDVDTSVIPAVIEQLGVESLDVLDGDAAIAWFNRNQPDTLHIARYQHSPLVMCQIEDGSFIFASTEQLLWKVLIQLDLMPTWLEKAKELDYFTVRDGMVVSQQMLPEPKFTGYYYDYSYYRHQTSGAKGTASTTNSPKTWNWEDYELWDWEEFDDDFYYVGNKSLASRWKEETKDDTSVELPKDTAYYIKLRENVDPTPYYLYYSDDESEMWKDELYLLVDEGNVQVIDYGHISNRGELVSAQDDLF